MVKITITKEVHDAIRAAAILPFKDTARVLPSGDLEIDIDEDTHERVMQTQLPGESISDTLLRGFAVMGGKVN